MHTGQPMTFLPTAFLQKRKALIRIGAGTWCCKT